MTYNAALLRHHVEGGNMLPGGFITITGGDLCLCIIIFTQLAYDSIQRHYPTYITDKCIKHKQLRTCRLCF